MTDEIYARVTPSSPTNTVYHLDGYDDETTSILSDVENAFMEAYIGVGRVYDAREAAKKNPTWNEVQQTIETASFADKMTMQLAKRFDGATN